MDTNIVKVEGAKVLVVRFPHCCIMVAFSVNSVNFQTDNLLVVRE